MIPDHVRTLEDYWLWLDSLVGGSAGWLDDLALIVWPIDADGGGGEADDWAGLQVPHQRLTFADGSHLSFDMVIDADFVALKYSYHYQEKDGRLIWRKCNHVGHDIGPLHLHVDPTDPDRVRAFKEIDLQEVIEEVWAYMERGELPG